VSRRRCPWRHQRIAGEVGAGRSVHHLAVAHDHDAVGIVEDLAEEVRDQDAASAALDEAAHEIASSWSATWLSSDDVGSSRMTRRTGVSVSEKARATSTICRRPIGRSPTMSSGLDAVAGEDLVELLADQLVRRGGASRSR
jgi:hypothetical protein